MPVEEIKVGEETHTIEVRPLTLIIPSARMAMGPPIQYPKRLPLDAKGTVYHARKVQKLHAEFEQVWRLFHSSTTPAGEVGEVSADAIRKMGPGAVHLMGLIDMTLKLQDQKVPLVWVYPESFLHPGWQVGLGDLAIFFARRGGGWGHDNILEINDPGIDI